MFDEAYELVAAGKTDDAIYSIMSTFDEVYRGGRFDDAQNELVSVDFSRLSAEVALTVAIVSWWARHKTGVHRQVVAAVEKKMLETIPQRRVNRCLDGLRR